MGLACRLPAASPRLSCLRWPRWVAAGGDCGEVSSGPAGRHAGTRRPQPRSLRVSPTRARVSSVATRKSACAGTCPWPDPICSPPGGGGGLSRGRLAPAVTHFGENGKIRESRGQACAPSLWRCAEGEPRVISFPATDLRFPSPGCGAAGRMLLRIRILTHNLLQCVTLNKP